MVVKVLKDQLSESGDFFLVLQLHRLLVCSRLCMDTVTLKSARISEFKAETIGFSSMQRNMLQHKVNTLFGEEIIVFEVVHFEGYVHFLLLCPH